MAASHHGPPMPVDLSSVASDLQGFQVIPPGSRLTEDDLKLPDGSPLVGPNGFLIPPARGFSSVINTGTRTYSYRFDEAMRDNFVAARAMRRDAFILGLLEERLLPTINRRWQLEVDNDKDPAQKAVRDALTKIVENIPNFDAFKVALLNAVWFGRAGAAWCFKRLEEVFGFWGISKWDPVHGDSVQFTFDGTPAILMDTQTTGWYASHGATHGPHGDIRPTDRGGMALVLQRDYWRDRYAIHRHRMEKADFFEGELAGSVQGWGLRGMVYWMYVVRQDALTWMLTYMQAIGQMDLMVFNFPAGNAAAELQQRQNAQQIIGKAAIICPRRPDGNWAAVEQISLNEAGLRALHQLISDYFDRHIERLIVGQSMSSGQDKGTGLGGTGRAEFAKSTKDEILIYDTNRLDETLTTDLLGPLKKYNFPWAKFPVRFKSTLPDLDKAAKVSSGATLIQHGVPIKVDEWREAAGFTRPEPGDEVVGDPMQMMMEQMMGGGGGGPPGMGGPPGGMTPPGMGPGGPGGPPMGGGAPGQLPGGSPLGVGGMAGPGGPPGGGMMPASRGSTAPTPYNPAMGYPGGSNTHLPGGQWFGPKPANIWKIPGATQYSGRREYSSTQFDLTGQAADGILQLASMIPDADLASDGREEHPHVTIRFGLHADDPLDVRTLLADRGPVSMRLGSVSVFEGDEHDVVKVDVESEGLRELNRLLGKLPHTDTHSEYRPHATIAYVKKGMGKKYAAVFGSVGVETEADTVVFSGKDRIKTPIRLIAPLGYERHGHRAPAGGYALNNKLYKGGRFAPAPPAQYDEQEQPSQEQPQQSQVTLHPGTEGRHMSGESMFTHPYTDQHGNELGVGRIIPRNDGRNRHVEWIGPAAGTAAGQAANSVGPATMRALLQQLARYYPNAAFVSGTRTKGANNDTARRVMMGIPGRYAGHEFRPARYYGMPY